MCDKAVFKKFMALRFPNERDLSYIEEWADRFRGGNPEKYMDSVSLEAYKMAKKLVF